ncbi:MAG: hypothetical protein SW833_16795 [Cyanobacteriota bacterium]|nr:hypothetical protein [Cyanobacteriota bacterium]
MGSGVARATRKFIVSIFPHNWNCPNFNNNILLALAMFLAPTKANDKLKQGIQFTERVMKLQLSKNELDFLTFIVGYSAPETLVETIKVSEQDIAEKGLPPVVHLGKRGIVGVEGISCEQSFIAEIAEKIERLQRAGVFAIDECEENGKIRITFNPHVFVEVDSGYVRGVRISEAFH